MERRSRELNEQGCFSMEVRHYDRAIRMFTEALDIVERYQVNTVSSSLVLPQSSSARPGQSYPLHYCLEYTRGYDHLINNGMQESDDNCYMNSDVVGSSDDVFLYRQPIRIPYEAITNGNNLGLKTLPLILVFNLALAYHLDAVHRQEERPVTRDHLENIMELYELSYFWHVEQQGGASVWDLSPPSTGALSSLKFIMMVANNMAHVYMTLQDTETSRLCFERILSIVMFLVDGIQMSSASDSGSRAGRRRVPPRTLSNILFSPQEMDGFLRNITTSLFVHSTAAAAA